MTFINNKYTKWYNAIITRASTRENSGYTEKHHIIPLSLLGNNKKDNIVILTPREHFICHLLLTKMTTGNGIYKMKYALSMIININHIGGGRYTPTGRTYSMAKRLQKEAIIDYWTEDKRKAHAELVRKKQKPRSQEGNASMIQYQKTKTWTEKALLNRTNIVKKSAEARTGVPLSPDHKAKISAAAHMRKLKFIDENISSIELAFDLEKNKVNRNQISKLTRLSWDRVDWILSSNRNIITEHLKAINRVCLKN